MTVMIRTSSGNTYSGATYTEIVDEMRRGDFNRTPTIRAYIEQASTRAGWLGRSLGVLPTGDDPVEELCKAFVTQAIRVGLAEKVDVA